MFLLPLLDWLDQRLHVELKVFIFAGGLLLLWRLWTFTIRPALRPDEPKELPYWVPFLGHAVAFFTDSEATFANGRKYFQNTREPFAITVAGQTLYIVTSPGDMSEVYKNTSTLSFHGFIRDLYAAMDVSPIGIRKMWETVKRGSGVSDNRQLHLGEGIHREQLHHGEHLEVMTAAYIKQIELSMSTNERPVVSLRHWCAEVLGTAALVAWFGENIMDIEPRLLEYFAVFDTDSWMLTYKYPRFLGKEMHAAKDVQREAFMKYFKLRPEERKDAGYYIRTVEAKQRKAGMTDWDIATTAQMFFWGANANPTKVAFWLLAYILFSPNLMDIIRKEISPSIRKGKIENLNHLLDQCSVLNSAFDEVLRLTSAASSARNVDSPTIVGYKTLRAGAKLLLPYRQLHLDEDTYGSDVLQFDAERFSKNKTLSRSSSFKPWGGGITLCSGRFLARRQVLTFAALALHQFDPALENPKQAFPRLDEKKATLGVMDPMVGDDVLVSLKPRIH